jgi:hypothetical protein
VFFSFYIYYSHKITFALDAGLPQTDQTIVKIVRRTKGGEWAATGHAMPLAPRTPPIWGHCMFSAREETRIGMIINELSLAVRHLKV